MRKIIHVDMDCFFAAVEMRDNPHFRHVPLAVGGSASSRGVISTCNYPARKFGVRSAMATGLALKLCPKLVVVKHSMRKYAEASEAVFEILRRYTSLLQVVSVDEAYLDVTESDLPHGSATLLAEKIRAEIFAATGLTASAGIASNKLLAKLASERNKPNGQCTVAPRDVANFMHDLPLAKLHGIGKVTADYLRQQGFVLCRDVLPLSRFELVARFGRLGDMLFESCRGIDERAVITEWERKSLSVEQTFAVDISDVDQMKLALHDLVEDLKLSLADYPEKKPQGLQVKLKYHDFRQTTIERAGCPIDLEAAWGLCLERWLKQPAPVRLLGVGVRFQPESEVQQLAFDALCLAG